MSLRTEAKAGVVRIAAYHRASAGKGVGGEGNRTWQPRPLGIRWLSPQSCGQPKKRGSMNSMKTHLVGSRVRLRLYAPQGCSLGARGSSLDGRGCSLNSMRLQPGQCLACALRMRLEALPSKPCLGALPTRRRRTWGTM